MALRKCSRLRKFVVARRTLAARNSAKFQVVVSADQAAAETRLEAADLEADDLDEVSMYAPVSSERINSVAEECRQAKAQVAEVNSLGFLVRTAISIKLGNEH